MKNQKIYLVVLILAFFFTAQGQKNSITTHKKTDLSLIGDYIDSLALAEMKASHIPGAVLVVIQDSSDVYTKAYGYADIENGVPVSNENTGFRIASVTKTFTATAVLQLVEKGKIDLHAPISSYLPDEDFSFLKFEPMTVHQLLTHTAGIDLTDIGDAELKAEDIVPLEVFARNHIPDQVNLPGTVHSYSNFGYTLLGYLIQQVSGMRYEDYIQENILEPLGMEMSNMDQPLAPPFKENLSRSYEWEDGHKIIPRDFTNTTPAGGMISTGLDMSRYMLVHLNNGSLDSVQILSPEFHKKLTSQQYGSEGTQYGVCYSFFENGWTGRRCIDHTGAQLGFLSMMVLIPETGTAIFIAQNIRENAGSFRFNMTRQIFDTLLHKNERYIELPGPNKELDELHTNYVGRYQQMNFPHSSFEKLGTLFGFYSSANVVKYAGDGMLKLNGDDFVMINERIFHRNDEKSPWNVEFVLDENGKASQIKAGTITYRKTPWYKYDSFWQMLIALPLLLIFINVFSRPILWVIKKIDKNRTSSESKETVANWIYYTGLLFVLGVVGISINSLLYLGQLADYGVPISLKIPLLLNTLGAISTLFFPFALVMLWRSKSIGLLKKALNSLLILALVILTVGFWYHNIVGFHY